MHPLVRLRAGPEVGRVAQAPLTMMTMTIRAVQTPGLRDQEGAGRRAEADRREGADRQVAVEGHRAAAAVQAMMTEVSN